ncbi:MAG: HEPN domain-containing protein [Nitrospirota bacterium]|nr:HEPN domain-containing protein [Nitrospirota bacterium]
MRDKEIKKLAEKSKKRLNIAKKMFIEKEFDIVVRESYFAMFYLTQAMLLTKNLGFSRHSAVIAAFGQKFSKTGEVDPGLHKLLIDAEKARCKSDYDYMDDITKEEAVDYLRDAEYFVMEIVKKLKGLMK